MIKYFFIAFLFVPVYSNGQSWTDADKKQLKEDCMKDAVKALIPGAANDYCSCYVEGFLSRFPLKTTPVSDTALMVIANRCIEEVKYRYPGGPFIDRWNDPAKASFISGCKQKLLNVKMDADAYCQCMLVKVMEVQPDPRLVNAIDPLILDKIASACLGR